MSSVPTIPIPSGGLSGSVGPNGINFSANLSLDRCNARPIFVYVVADKGNVWRVFDPLSPTEKLPIWKEWTEEITHTKPKGHWEEIPPPPPQKPPHQEPPPPPPPCHLDTHEYLITDEDGDTFKFDEPGRNIPVGNPAAFSDPGRLPTISAEIDQKMQQLVKDDQGNYIDPDQAGFKPQIVMFAHADMCGPFSYNQGLTSRRAASVKLLAMSAAARSPAVLKDVATCADFNPKTGPDDPADTGHDELRAEQSAGGTVTAHTPGNRCNRRFELFIYPEFKDGQRSRRTEALERTFDAVQGELGGRTVPGWTRGTFPCRPGDTTPCHHLCVPFDSPRDPAGVSASSGLTLRKHQNMDTGGNALGTGPDFRQCVFYKHFKEEIAKGETVTIHQECPQPQPQPQPEQPPAQPPPKQYRWVDDGVEETKETIGEYHPPPGEHYAYYMDEMVRTGVACGPEFAPVVAVAPNKKVNADDFNLIKAGPIRVVKMDIGFWGDERKLDTSRKAGFKRVPARSFGLIEGQFVFLCYFQTKDNAGFVKGCSDTFDDKLTPLCAKLAKAVKDSGDKNNKILILAKAVAEDGPDPTKLQILFPDMHLPRRFDDKDPVYASDQCLFRVQMVKSMILHQLKRDYRLPASQTPWLAILDRRLCRDFFENNAPKLKLPHWDTGRAISNPFDPAGSGLDAAVDAVKKAYQALMQVGFYMFEFTQDDYRRMVRSYPKEFPEKGYGRTKDILFNWFYGFETDKNNPPPQKSGIGEELKSMVPGVIADVTSPDASVPWLISKATGKPAGLNLGPDAGTKPAVESYDRVDAGPARDLLRFLKVIGEQKTKAGLPVQVFHTGDLYEMWANRRFLFEDFEDASRPDGQTPNLTSKLAAGGSGPGVEFLKSVGRGIVCLILGGVNAQSHDLWVRREADAPADSDDPLHPEKDLLPPEESWNLDSIDDDFMLPQFVAPKTPGAVGIGTDPNHPLKTPNVHYTNIQLNDPKKSVERRKGYLVAEAARRISQVEALEAPLRKDDPGKKEDTELLGAGNIVGKNKDRGRWNKAVIDQLKGLGTKMIYGNHDDYRGVPRISGMGRAQPYHSEPGLWVEHGHRFEDSNLDGQPFGSFLTNLAFEIQELPFAEGLLDEYILHREQSTYQPGIMSWFLLTEFGLDKLDPFQHPPDNVPAIHRFRISVNSHTHVPDLVVAQIIFKEREATPWEAIINIGGAVLKGLLLLKKFVDWAIAWNDRHGFQKWWDDIQGVTINWGVDFAGLAGCIDKAIDFLKKQGENAKDKLKKEWDQSKKTFKQAVDQNAKNLGLPPP